MANNPITSKRSRTGPVFRDLLYLLALSFAVLFITALIQINPISKKSEIERKAEFLVVMEWNHNYSDDVDLWVQDPTGKLVFFRNREAGFLHLDRDDIGVINDSVEFNGIVKTIDLNREVITVRGIIRGEYTVNVHMYKKNVIGAATVTVEIIKVNPYRVIWKGKHDMTANGEEYTMVRFELDDKGNTLGTNTDQIRFVPSQPGNAPTGEDR